MESDHSNKEFRSSETMTESADRERVLPNRQDDLELESDVLNREVTRSESMSKSPAQTHLLSRSPDGEVSAVAMAVHQGFKGDDRGAAVPFPRTPALQPVNMVAEQSLDSLLADGFGNSSREFDAMSGFQLSDSGSSSQYSYLESSTAQASDSSARRDSVSDDNQTKVGAGIGLPWNHSEAAQPVLDHDSGDDAPRTTFRAVFPEENVLPPLRFGSLENEEERRLPTDNTSLPSIANLTDSDERRPWPTNPLTGVHTNIQESRRWELQTVAYQAPRLVQGSTQRFGPPMKPFDDAISEAVAQEQWRHVTEKERREA